VPPDDARVAIGRKEAVERSVGEPKDARLARAPTAGDVRGRNAARAKEKSFNALQPSKVLQLQASAAVQLQPAQRTQTRRCA